MDNAVVVDGVDLYRRCMQRLGIDYGVVVCVLSKVSSIMSSMRRNILRLYMVVDGVVEGGCYTPIADDAEGVICYPILPIYRP